MLAETAVTGVAMTTLTPGLYVEPVSLALNCLVSSTVKDIVGGSDARFEDRGPHSLKGMPGEWRLFSLAD